MVNELVLCNGLHWSWEIRAQWPGKVKYLPRPEPPKKYKEDHTLWENEYRHWKDLRCGRQRGFFCRKHGMWIRCDEVEDGVGCRQEDELQVGNPCPPRHDDLQRMIRDFHTEHAHLRSQVQQTPYVQEVNQEGEDDGAVEMAGLSMVGTNASAAEYYQQGQGQGHAGSAGYGQQHPVLKKRDGDDVKSGRKSSKSDKSIRQGSKGGRAKMDAPKSSYKRPDEQTQSAASEERGPYPEGRHDQPYGSEPYGGTGYEGVGYQQSAYDTTGYPATGYENTVYPATGYENTGYETTSYETTGYQVKGYQSTDYEAATDWASGHPDVGSPQAKPRHSTRYDSYPYEDTELAPPYGSSPPSEQRGKRVSSDRTSASKKGDRR